MINEKIKNSTEEELHKILLNTKKITITTHVSPDGDAIGSELALYFYCLQRDIQARIINCSETPYNLQFLSGIENVNVYKEGDKEYIMNSDAVFVLDLNSSPRIKVMEDVVLQSKAIKIVIDHHIEPSFFADYYHIDSASASTGELIWKILNCDKQLKITPEIASALYTAIMTDTGSFRFPHTTSETHLIIAELIKYGADHVKIYEEVYNIIPYPAVLLQGEAYASSELFYDGKLVVMTLTKEIFKKTGGLDSDIEGIVEHTVTIKGVQAGVLITERPNDPEIRISFRSKGDINVRELAVELGGGGHFHAAGARLSNATLSDAKKLVIEKTGKFFEQPLSLDSGG
ncbi:MAG: bifunctional oligoribonuclease/PAP phosphatase NrnA [Bacteroidetes bacterium]|nr:bifunctional oligoribonuclease/PAP phosphatase NrnA [Bacteroidota bacterium]